jgi:hypothetical protein
MDSWLSEFLDDEVRIGVWRLEEPDGFPTWAYFRSRAATERYRRATNTVDPFHARTTLRQHLSGHVQEHVRSLRGLTGRGQRAFDAVFFTNALLATTAPDGNGMIDRTHEGYFRLCQNPLIMQELHTGRFAAYDQWSPRVYCSSTWMVFVRRLFELPALARPALADDEVKVAALSAMFQDHVSPARLRRDLRRLRGALRFYAHFVGRLIDPRMQRRLAFVNDACGLGQNALLTHALRQRGYVIVEVQHGVINENVFECQYSAGLDPRLPAKVLPDVMWTFGQKACELVSPMIRCRPVGHYYLWRMAREPRSAAAGRPSQPAILIVSQGSAARRLTAAAEAVATAFPAATLVYKLHPGEQLSDDARQRLQRLSNVRVAQHESVYTLIAESDVLIGHSSLALLEAAFFDDKRIFMLPNCFLPSDLGFSFDSDRELLAAIRDPSRGRPKLDAGMFWNRDWEGAAQDAFRELGGMSACPLDARTTTRAA